MYVTMYVYSKREISKVTDFRNMDVFFIDLGCPSVRPSVIDSFPGCISVTDGRRDLKKNRLM